MFPGYTAFFAFACIPFLSFPIFDFVHVTFLVFHDLIIFSTITRRLKRRLVLRTANQ